MPLKNPVIKFAQELMADFDPSDKLVYGTIDITEHINFQDTAEALSLTSDEYEQLIQICQLIANIELKKYNALQDIDDGEPIDEVISKHFTSFGPLQ